MQKVKTVVVAVVLVLTLGAGASRGQDSNASVIIAEGFAAPNAYAGALPDFFTVWCADSEDGAGCIPTVQLPVTDVKKTRVVGTIYAWGKDFKGQNGTLQFKEFVLYDLRAGQIFTLSQDGGHPGGAFADPTLVPPKQGEVVVTGGAEGQVVGGNGKYAGASGGYSTRLKVEVSGGFFNYYDELYFRFRSVKIE